MLPINWGVCERRAIGAIFPERSAIAILRKKRPTAPARAQQQVADIVSEARLWTPIEIWIGTNYQAETVPEAVESWPHETRAEGGIARPVRRSSS